MTKRDDIKKQVEEQDEQTYGNLAKAAGHKPKPGQYLADEVREAEKSRRGIQPHEEEEQEEEE